MAAAPAGEKITGMDFRTLYDGFDAPLVPLDCGTRCAEHHPRGLPFCCDACHAVPAAYLVEWDYLAAHTAMWHEYRGDECDPAHPEDPYDLLAETPEHMLLLVCQGAARCQRPVRALSCRQFPFYPYVNAQGEFIGLAYEWAFEQTCWVISHLDQVTPAYRREFIQTFDALFAAWEHDLDSYAAYSEEARTAFIEMDRRIPLLHRDGSDYLINPQNGDIQPTEARAFSRFGPYLTDK